jgi:hypothetical protein
MKLQRWADFFFVGVVVLPGVLLWMEYFDLGVLLLLPMLFVACGFGILAQEFPADEAAEPVKPPPRAESKSGTGSSNVRNR